jgi:hypothetical protein
VAELGRRLKPVESAPAAVTGPLLAELGSGSFKRREAAARQLRELGDRAEAALRTALAANPGEETRRRIESLLAGLDAALRPENVRELRAVALLELAGTEEARRVLAVLASGIPSAPLTREARAALARLAGGTAR